MKNKAFDKVLNEMETDKDIPESLTDWEKAIHHKK
jgi:hypothetical protein